jgi:hypothetical protein
MQAGARTHPMLTPSQTTFPPCPACGSLELLEIVYGYPGHELFEADARGEVVLGGCVVGPESPDYECRDCHAPLPWVAPRSE